MSYTRSMRMCEKWVKNTAVMKLTVMRCLMMDNQNVSSVYSVRKVHHVEYVLYVPSYVCLSLR